MDLLDLTPHEQAVLRAVLRARAQLAGVRAPELSDVVDGTPDLKREERSAALESLLRKGVVGRSLRFVRDGQEAEVYVVYADERAVRDFLGDDPLARALAEIRVEPGKLSRPSGLAEEL